MSAFHGSRNSSSSTTRTVVMLEDLVYELLPVVGFAALASSVFVIVAMRKAVGAFRFIVVLAIADILLGLTLIANGFNGVITTIYGTSGETVQPFSCVFSKSLHLLVSVYSDALHSLLLIWFSSDRLLQMLIPSQYSKISVLYTCWPFILIFMCGCGGAVVPSLELPLEHRHNLSFSIPSLCRFQEVFGDEYYSLHMWALQWAPLLGLGIVILSLVVFTIRSTRLRWTYSWADDRSAAVQLSAVCVLRCLLAAVAIHLPLLVVANQPPETELSLLMDFFVRISFAICIPILQPIYYLLVMPLFLQNVQMMFNKYSHNTKRTWQSASDPPKVDEHVDPHGDRNPFGSWYSNAGNINGEAGIPTEESAKIERSVSFYYGDDQIPEASSDIKKTENT